MDTLEAGARSSTSNRSLRVAFVVPALYGNGAERSILRIAGGMIERGHEVDLVLLRPVIDLPDEIPRSARLVLMEDSVKAGAENVPMEALTAQTHSILRFHSKLRLPNCIRMLMAMGLHPLVLPSVSIFREAQFVANYVREEAPDCIVPILPKGKVATLLAKSLPGSFPTTVASVRNDLRFRRRREIQRYRRLLPHSDHVIAISHGVRSSVVQIAEIPARRVTSIYNPVVSPHIMELANRPPQHTWLSNDGPPIILGVGRLVKQKDFPTLLKAFQLVSNVRSVRLIILGEGRQRARLQKLVEKLGLDGRVSLPGYVNNPYAFMARASVFVLSSKFEGLGNVLVEALACGCPCVSTNCLSGPAEILADGQIGPLVPVGDHVALADAIESMLDEPPERHVLRRRADLFSVESSVAMYEEVLLQCTDGRV